MDAVSASHVFREIAGAVGEETALLLIKEFGGIALYIPENMGNDHPVAVALGPRRAKDVHEYFAGVYLKLPKDPFRARSIAERRSNVIALFEAGEMTVKQIALATDFTERHVYRILASRMNQNCNQLDLFEA